MKKLEGTFQVASGTNYHPNVPFSRAIANISYRTTVTPEITDDSITFAGLIKAGVYEAMLIMDNVAVMRDYHGTETATNVTRTINNSHFCDMIGMYVWIGSVTQGGNPVSDYEQREYYEKLTEDGVNILPYRLPEGARFLGEPIGNYFAVETDHEVVVYVVEETKSSVCYKVPRGDGEPCLCSDGSIFTSDGEFVVRYKVSEGAVQKTEYARSAAVKNVHAVVSEKRSWRLSKGRTTFVWKFRAKPLRNSGAFRPCPPIFTRGGLTTGFWGTCASLAARRFATALTANTRRLRACLRRYLPTSTKSWITATNGFG